LSTDAFAYEEELEEILAMRAATSYSKRYDYTQKKSFAGALNVQSDKYDSYSISSLYDSGINTRFYETDDSGCYNTFIGEYNHISDIYEE